MHAAGVHFVHIKDGTAGDLLVVGVLFDVTEYGSNLEVGRRESSLALRCQLLQYSNDV